MSGKDNTEYVQAYVPDYTRLAYLIQKAKGTDRSMAEFARMCKVKGPSTFSRIVNELIDKPISDELIYAVAKNAADPFEVNVDSLMRANGKVPSGELRGRKSPVSEENTALTNFSEMKKLVKNVLLEVFEDKGYPVMVYPGLLRTGDMPESRHYLARLSDFALHLQGQDPLYWNFIVDHSDLPERLGSVNKGLSGESAKERKQTIKKFYLKESMAGYASLFLRDAWEPETMKDFKNTIVFTDEESFDAFCGHMSDVRVNSWISLMLVDVEKKKIVRETELKKKK